MERSGLFARMAALTAVYVATAKLALMMDAVSGFATLVWPPAGIALAALLRGGSRMWPSIAVGAFLVNLWNGAPLVSALGIAAGNTIEAVIGYVLIRRVVSGAFSLARLRDVSALVFGAAGISAMIAASVGVLSLVAGQVIGGSQLGETWRAWWLGDAVGIVVVAPLLLLRAVDFRVTLGSRSWAERVTLALAVMVCAWVVFGPSGLSPANDSRQAYLMFPVLIWAATRFRERGAVVITFAMATTAVAGTALGHGPFASASLHENLIGLQAFMMVLAVTGLLLGASKAQLEAADARAAFLTRTSEILAGSLNYEVTVEQVAHLAVPSFADWCVVDVIEGERNLRRLAVAAADPAKRAAMLELRDRYPPTWDSPQPAGHALRTGKPYLRERLTSEALVALTRDEQHLALMRRLDPRSAMAFPLVTSSRTVGVITFALSESGRRYGPDDLAFGEEIARRAAVAVENARLHRASEWWEHLFEHAGWGVALTDAATGLFHAVNPAFARMHGYTIGDLTGKPLMSVCPPDQHEDLQRQAQVAEEAGRATFESVHVRKDGTRFPVSIDLVALKDAAGRVIRAANVVDISERVKLLESEQTARIEAERASRAKDEFLAMLGHELRNPLSPIVTALQLMKLRGGKITGKEQEVIERQVRHLVRLVDDLLDISRITRGKIDLDRRPVEIAEVVLKAVEMAGPLFEQRKHILNVNVPHRGMRVDGDLDRLAQVLANLLTNAAKYTPPAGRVDVTARRDGAVLRLSVRDNGIGISEDLLPRMFDAFVQGEQSSERSEGGLGIGLSLVRSLVAMHGGEVTATSGGAGRGSEFVVKLPLLPADAAEATPVPETVRPFKARAPLRILVVDDNRDAAESLAEILQFAGYDVTVAFDPVEALAAVDEARPDVAILDVGLPVMDGYELARRIRERVRGAPPQFIAVTGYGQERDRARSTSAGFESHLVKPVDADVLLRVLEGGTPPS